MIIPHDFGAEGVDATSIRIPGIPPLFFYNPALSGDRLRFTLAHELGHIVMHEIPHPGIENEADKFAAEFLMPARDIGQYLTGLTLPKAAQLKPFWKVSMAAIVYRAKELGKISDTQFRYLFYQLGAGNMRKKEPTSLDVPIEQPTIQRNLLDFFRKELGYSNTDLAKLFRLTVTEFDRYYASRAPARRLSVVS
jgi:Zn-dependent peptidase ImmA (M78 family)